jgi:hypothetical protein
MHPFEELGVARRSIVQLALPHVIARDEECRFRIVLLQDVKHLLGEDVRPVVECQRYMALVFAEIETGSSVADVS